MSAKIFVYACLISLLISSPALSKEKLLITGSSTIAPLMLEISKAFESKYQNQVRVDVQTGGSSRGIRDQRKGVAHLGMVSRTLKKNETDLKSHLIAKDGVTVILNSKNPISTLQKEDIVKIYKGQIKNWHQLGGQNAPITVVHKAEGRSTLEVFLNYFNLKNDKVKPSVIIGDNEQGIKTVAGNPYAIGYVSIGTAEFNQKMGVPIKALPLKGITASTKNVKNGLFPLSRDLILVLKGKPNLWTKRLIEFSKSKEVSHIVEQLYFIPVTK